MFLNHPPGPVLCPPLLSVILYSANIYSIPTLFKALWNEVRNTKMGKILTQYTNLKKWAKVGNGIPCRKKEKKAPLKVREELT